MSLSDAKSNTFRSQVKIPKLPRDTSDLLNYPNFNMHKAELIEDRLIFCNKNAAEDILKTGFFLLKIPSNLDLQASDSFAKNFFKEKDGCLLDDNYKGYKHVKIDKEYQGYFDRLHDQWENFYIESEYWPKFLPENIQVVGRSMADLGIKIIINIFKKLQIPKHDWDKVSGGLTACKGHKMLGFNHFRPEKQMRGTKLHRDSGWVTILRSTEPGLIALIQNKLYAINPEPGYFIVNFGSSFEVLTTKLISSVRANIHGVVKTLKKPNNGPDRVSYVIFLDSDLSEYIYQYDDNTPKAIQTMKDFAIQEVSRTYDDDIFL